MFSTNMCQILRKTPFLTGLAQPQKLKKAASQLLRSGPAFSFGFANLNPPVCCLNKQYKDGYIKPNAQASLCERLHSMSKWFWTNNIQFTTTFRLNVPSCRSQTIWYMPGWSVLIGRV